MSGIQRCASESPASPFEPHIASPNRVLVEGLCAAQLPIALAGLSCAAILHCALRPSAAQAFTPPPDFVSLAGAPVHVTSQNGSEYKTKFFISLEGKHKAFALDSKIGSANDAKQRDPPRDEVRWENERTSSPRPQIAKQNRVAGEPKARAISAPHGAPTKTRFGEAR